MNNNRSTEIRPFSDSMVDLHVSVVPMKHWVEKLNYASHKIIGDTFSAGFIRVLPDTSVSGLRHEINEQLGADIFPPDYVFLKHVGRCLALVRQSQEKQLKVKNFLPPHSIMPEIFVLPGQPAMYAYKVLPPIQPRLEDLHSSNPDTISDHTNLKANGNPNRSLQTKSPFKYSDVTSSSRTSAVSPALHKTSVETSPAQNYQLRANSNDSAPSKTRIPSSIQHRDVKRQQRHVSGKSNYDNDVSLTHSKELAQRSNDFNARGDDERRHSPVPLPEALPDERRTSLAKSVLREGPRKRRVRYNMPPQSNASSQDNDSRAGVAMISHSVHRIESSHFDRTPSDSDSSYRSEARDSPGTRFPDSHPHNGRVRRHFVDTSTHALLNSTNHAQPPVSYEIVAEVAPNRSATNSSSRSPSSPISHPVDPSPTFDDVNYASDRVHLKNTHPSPPSQSINAVEQTDDADWQSRGNDEPIKSSSANNDSGYVDHELSESDEYFFKSKSRRSASSAEDDQQQKQEDHEDEEEESGHEDAVRRHSSALHADDASKLNQSVSSDMKSGNGDHVTVSSDSAQPISNSDGSHFGEVSKSIIDESNHLSQRIDATAATGQAAPEPVNRVLSHDSAHQFDFYDRSGPPPRSGERLTPSNSATSSPECLPPPSPDSENGSKLSYRLSKQGYRIKSSGSRNYPVEMGINSDGARDQLLPDGVKASMSFDQKTTELIHNEDSDQEENDLDSDGYESSVDEFQQELANLVNRNNTSDHDTPPPINPVKDQEDDVPLFRDEPKSREPLVDRSRSSPRLELPQRESISGSSVRSGKSTSGQSIQITLFTTSTLDDTAEKYLSGAVLEHDDPLEMGQSRGDPDGMPTQRKVNTSSNDKQFRSLPSDLVSANTPSQTTQPEPPEILKLNPDVSAAISEPTNQKAPTKIKAESNEKQRNFEVGTAPDAERQTQPRTEVEKVDQINSSPEVSSPLHIPEFQKPDDEKENVVAPKSPASTSTSEQPQEKSPESTELPVAESQSDLTVTRLGSPAKAKLWEELQQVRADRRKAEKIRQELVQQAKVVTSKMNQRRSTVRDQWKKKFFEEKKKTLPLEDTCRRLQSELDSSHRRLVTAMESNKQGPSKKFPPLLPPPVFTPSTKRRRRSLRTTQKNNNKIQAARLQHDMDNLRRKIEDAKIKLTGEIKLRHQAEQDVKMVRQELLAKKIRAHIAYREVSRVLRFPVKT